MSRIDLSKAKIKIMNKISDCNYKRNFRGGTYYDGMAAGLLYALQEIEKIESEENVDAISE